MTEKIYNLLQTRTHPGITLSEKLVAIGLSSREFAKHIGKSEEIIDAVLCGKSAITAELAVQIESVTQISAHFWLKSQHHFDYYIARQKYIPMASLDINKHYTYEDCLSWPEGYHCEIINGVPIELPSKYVAQALVSSSLLMILHSHIEDMGYQYEAVGGIVDVRLPKNGEIANDKIDTVVQPDIVLVRDLSKIDEWGCCGAPDMIIEILTPTTLKNDLIRKFLLYEEHGVKEYWMVHPNDKAITVFLLQKTGKFSDGYLYEFEGKVPVFVLDNFLVDLEEVFESLEDFRKIKIKTCV